MYVWLIGYVGVEAQTVSVDLGAKSHRKVSPSIEEVDQMAITTYEWFFFTWSLYETSEILLCKYV